MGRDIAYAPLAETALVGDDHHDSGLGLTGLRPFEAPDITLRPDSAELINGWNAIVAAAHGEGIPAAEASEIAWKIIGSVRDGITFNMGR